MLQERNMVLINVWPYDSKTLYKVNNEIKVYHASKFMAANIYGKSLP